MLNFFRRVWGRRKELGFLSLPLFFTALIFMDYALRFVYSFTGSVRLLAKFPFLFTGGWALLITALISLLPKLGRRIAMGAVGGLVGFLAFLHAVMFNIFGHFFSFHDMNFAGDGLEAFSWAYLKLPKKYLLCIGIFLGLVTLAICLCQRPRPLKKPWIRPALSVSLAVLSLLPIYACEQILAPKEGIVLFSSKGAYNPADNRELYRLFTDSNRCMKLTGLYQYTFRNLITSLGWNRDTKSIRELDEFYAAREQEISGDNEMTGLLEGKNLIMIMMESIDTWMVSEDTTPNLYRLQQEGVSFQNFYTPLFISAATFNTEIISQSGLIPPPDGAPSGIYSTNSFPLALPRLFADEGYQVNSFHSNNGVYYSRFAIHPNLGFSSYHNFKAMGMDDHKLDTQLMNGFELFAPKENQPFYSFIITFSGHGPYDGDYLWKVAEPHFDKAQAYVEASGIQSTEENLYSYTRALAQAMETDAFIGLLVERLEKEGLMEDTVLCLYADHYGKYIPDKEFLNQIKGGSGEPELYHTPCLLYGGGLEPRQVEKYCCSVDLLPTLLNLFGLDAPRQYYVGDDIFGDRGGTVMLPNGAWYNGESYFSGEGQDSNPELTANLSLRVAMSMETLRSDYFASSMPELEPGQEQLTISVP